MTIQVLIFILGLIFGSFLNMLIYRLANNISLFNPSRSICPKCNTIIKWHENIPLFSYLLLKARCSNCKTKIPFSYFFIELFTAIITISLFNKINTPLEFTFTLFFFYLLIVLSFIDIKYKAVPDYLLLFALVLSIFISNDSFYNSIKNAILFAGAFVLLNFFITFYIQNIKSKLLKDATLKTQEALGEGDIPIIASIGAVLGLKLGVIAIFLSAVFAIIPAIYSNFIKKEIEIPFIPYLTLGLFVTFIFDTFLKTIIGQ